MQILDGKLVATTITDGLQRRIAELRERHGVQPGLAVVLVGEDPASQVYVRNKVRTSAKIGMHSLKFVLPAHASQEQVLELVRQLNADPQVHGLLVQSPPPPQIDERAIIAAIDPEKDVDCFHPRNVGKLLIGDEDGLLPCTPMGIVAILRHYRIPTRGRHAVVLGRSNIVGKPIAALLARKAETGDCTVTVCHSRTPDLARFTRQADILVAAIGRPELVKADMVREGAVVIDVGMNRVDEPGSDKGYRLVGDVDFADVSPKCEWITPVPGGVGLMTVAMLMNNTVKACCRQHGLSLAGLY